MILTLPKSLEVDGKEYEINTDFRDVLNIMFAYEDDSLSTEEKIFTLLTVLYKDYEQITNVPEAVEKGIWFLDCGEETSAKSDNEETRTRQMMWSRDLRYIIPPINRMLGYGNDVRSVEYMHWWTFISYYMEIGDCFFSSVVSIRHKLAKHKKLEDYEKTFYNENQDIIDLPVSYTDEELKILKEVGLA